MNTDFHIMIEALGWSLLHFLWQGTVIALALGCVLRLIRRSNAQSRYLLAGLAFLTMLSAFVATMVYHWQTGSPIESPAATTLNKLRPASSGLDASITATSADALPGEIREHRDEPIASVEAGAMAADETGTIPNAENSLVESTTPPLAQRPHESPFLEGLRPALPWVVGIWIGGVTLFTLRLFSAWLYLRRLRNAGEPPADPAWRVRFAALCESMRVSRPVTLLSSSAVAIPIVMGWLKPVILVPAGLFAGLSSSQLEAILAHELAHVRRHDFIVNFLQNLVETFLFFHPAVWWVSGQIRKEREHCCDDVASSQCGGPVDYARALAALEENCGGFAQPQGSLAASGGSLIGRIRRLIGVPQRDSAPGVSLPAGLAAGFMIVTLAAGLSFVRGTPQLPAEEPGNEPGEAASGEEPTPINIYPTASDIHQLTPEVKLVIKRESDRVNRPRDSVSLRWKDDQDRVQSTPILSPPERLAPMRVVGNILWVEIPPAFGDGLLGLRRIDFSDPGNLKEKRWTSGELGYSPGIPFPVNGRKVRAVDGSTFLWLSKARACHGPTVLIMMDPKVGDDTNLGVVLNSSHMRSVSRLIKRAALLPPQKASYDVRLALNDKGTKALALFGEKHPGQELRLNISGEFLPNKIEIDGEDVVLVKGPFDEESGRVVASYIERILRGAEAPDPEADLANPMTEITKAGTYEIDENTKVFVNSDVEDSGITRNALSVVHTDERGAKQINTAALPYGEGTWAILVARPMKKDKGVLRLAIADSVGVALYKSLTAAELKRNYIQRAGYTNIGLFPAARIAGGGPIIHAPEWSDWMRRVQPTLKKETEAPMGPEFELRLLARFDEPAELIRRTPAGYAVGGPRKFERLAQRLLSKKDFKSINSGMIMAGMVFTDFLVKEESQAEFDKLCQEFTGRTAVLVQNGEVWTSVELKQGLKKISSPNGNFGAPKAVVKKAAPPKRAKAVDGANKPDPFAIPDDPTKAKAAEAKGIRIDVLGAAGRKPIQEFRIIAGVRSGVSRAFENANGVEVANWQSHTLHQGRNGGLIWPLNKAYKEMALRIEADGYIPQTKKWIMQADGAQKLTILLQEDPGVSGSVMTPGNGRAAHDATVVLTMIRRNARIKGTVFPELDLGDPNRKLTARDIWHQPLVVKPDGQGRFTLPTETDPTAVVLILHGDGVFEMPYKDWKKSPNVTLLPWGRIHGRVRWGKNWGEEEQIDLSASRGDKYGYPGIISQSDDTVSDKEGRFVFQRVLPGRVQLSCPIEVETEKGEKRINYVEGRITHADVKAPHTAVMLGGYGRKVTGQLTGRDDWKGVTFHFHPNAPRVGFGSDDSMWQAWHALKEGPSGPTYFREGLKVAADGSFEIPGVLPGYYQIFFRKEGVKGWVASSQFRIKGEDRDKRPDPEVLPDIRARPAQTR